jgi:hypothetical protein
MLFNLVLVCLYFFFIHPKVLNKLGLSQRDDTLMLIGFLMNTVFSTLFRFIDALMIGQLDLGSLIFAGLISLMVYFNYKRL